MYPELFKIGPFTVYSYGLMLGIAFITASWLLAKEVGRIGELYEQIGNITGDESEFRQAQKYYKKAEAFTRKHGSAHRADHYLTRINGIRRKLSQTTSRDNEEVGLHTRLSGALTIFFLLFGILLSSFTITGNSIANLSSNSTQFIGAGLFILGLITGLFWLKQKNN